MEDVDTMGVTPLMIACQVGRLENARFIVDHLKEKRGDLAAEAKMGVAGVNRKGVNTWSALYYAVSEGHLEIVK